jgi:hypothetical protein
LGRNNSKARRALISQLTDARSSRVPATKNRMRNRMKMKFLVLFFPHSHSQTHSYHNKGNQDNWVHFFFNEVELDLKVGEKF